MEGGALTYNGRKDAEARRAIISDMLSDRPSIREIVRALEERDPPIKVSSTTVHKDIKLIEARYLEQQMSSLGVVRARELAELEHMEGQVARAWLKSVEKGKPDPRLMRERRHIKEQRARLLGLNTPEVILHLHGPDMTDVGEELSSLTDEELLALAAQAEDIIDVEPEPQDDFELQLRASNTHE